MDIPKFKSYFFKHKDKIYKYLLILASILISFFIFYFKDSFAKLSNYGYLGIFLISVLGNSTVVVPAPVIATAFIGGSIYNPVVVGVVTALGATIGEMTGYLAGSGGQAFIEENKHFKRVEKWMSINGFLTILFLAAIPNPLFDVAGIFSGVTKYPLKKFLLATLIGKTIKFVTVSLIGSRFV